MNGYFGYNCTQTCATDVCAETDVCNKTNGECLKGCKYPGYQAPRCVARKCKNYYIYYASVLTLVLLNPDIPDFANSVDPDQLASEEAN